jgi:hypothetical protein
MVTITEAIVSSSSEVATLYEKLTEVSAKSTGDSCFPQEKSNKPNIAISVIWKILVLIYDFNLYGIILDI